MRQPRRPFAPAVAAPLLLACALALGATLAACGSTSEPGSTGQLASPVETGGSGSPSPSPAPTTEPVVTTAPAGGASPTASPPGTTDPPTAEAFWATVRRGLEEAGHLVISADGPAPVSIRYLPDASEALVGGDLVSRCVGTRSWAGDAGSLAPVPGLWRCGADALVAGFRATAAPIDSWSPDFPVEGSPEETLSVAPDGTWTWRYEAADGLDGPLTASLTLDSTSGRVRSGSRTDDSGKTTWTFDYDLAVDPIIAP